jgi:hypothetical protein
MLILFGTREQGSGDPVYATVVGQQLRWCLLFKVGMVQQCEGVVEWLQLLSDILYSRSNKLVLL